MATRRWSMVVAGAMVAASTMVSPLAGALGTATSTPSSSLVPGRTYQAIGVPVCPRAKPGHPTCAAMIRELVPVGTPSAQPFQPAAGAMQPADVGPDGGLTPADLASAYRLPTTGGQGQTMAVIDAYNDPRLNKDLFTFDRHYDLRRCTTNNGCLKVVSQTGSTTALPRNDTTGWSDEETLDVEVAHAICQGCKLLVVEASSSSSADLGQAVNEAVALGANEVSNSYGGPESETGKHIAADYNHPGVVITAASGDDGWNHYDQMASIDEPDTPAAYPTVVSVGGTSLTLRSNGRRRFESVWNDNGLQDYNQQVLGTSLGATGGGCSTIWPAPAWQLAEPGYRQACTGTRLENDVAAVASPITGFDIFDSFDCGSRCHTGWQTYGGTSLATPLIAGAYALAGGGHGVAYPALTLYGHPGATYDVQRGGDGWCDGESPAQCVDPNLMGDGLLDCAFSSTGALTGLGRACDAFSGFDGPTGVGTPVGLEAFSPTGPTGTLSGPDSVTPGSSQTWQVAARDPFPGASVAGYVWHWGDGSPATVTATPSAAHTYTATGSHTVSVTMTDSYGQRGAATEPVSVAG